MIDQLKNKYFFDKAIIDFKKNEIIGDELKLISQKEVLEIMRTIHGSESIYTIIAIYKSLKRCFYDM